MRILYHHRTRGRNVEGVHIRGIVQALRGMGHEVEVLSFPGADPERQVPAGHSAGSRSRGRLATLVTRLPGVMFEAFELLYNLVTVVRVHFALRRMRPHFVYERYSLFLCASVWLARRRGIPIILEINDSAMVQRMRPLYLQSVARRIEAWCMRNSTGLVFISTYFQRLAKQTHGAIAPSVVSPNAADAERFDPDRFDSDRLRAERGLSGRVVCGHVGVFAPWHGVAEFVERIAEHLVQAPNLCLLLVGDGPDLPATRELVRTRGLDAQVRLPGRVDHAEIASWIACMDYAVLPNSNEYGSPMKVFEFMAMRAAVVAPDYAPVAEVINDGQTGWLFPHGQIDVCVERVLSLASDAEQRQRVGAAARAYTVRERQWSNNARQLLALIPPLEE